MVLYFIRKYVTLQVEYDSKPKKMRCINWVLLGLGILLTSCKGEVFIEENTPQGHLSLFLSQDETVYSKTEVETESNLPDIGEFIVEIYENSTDRLFFRKKYSDAVDKMITLNEGEHRLLAYYGNPAVAGFNSYYYESDMTFNIVKDEVAQVEAVAKLANVKVAVNFGDNLKYDHQTFYAEVKSTQGKALRFLQDETRAGYVPVGEVSVTLFIYINEKWLCYKAPAVECFANDFVTFNVDTRRYGDATIEITIDRETDPVNVEYDVPADAAPQSPPEYTISGFEEQSGNKVNVLEADVAEFSGYKADIVAMYGVKECILTVNSSFLNSAGIPQNIDLANVDEQTESLLKEYGIKFLRDMSGKRLSYIDFTGVVNYIARNVPYRDNSSVASFSFKVTDQLDRTVTSDTYSVYIDKSESTLSIQDVNIWATKIYAPELTVTKGDPTKFVLKYTRSNDMTNSNVKVASIKSIDRKTGLISFNDITGLSGGTRYKFWVVYNDNNYNRGSDYEYITESAAQIGNSGFEQWQDLDYTVKITAAGTNTRKWALPYTSTSSAWWAVNSLATMPSKTSATNFNYKVFPTVGYSTTNKYSGSRSAQILTINVNWWNTAGTNNGDNTVGEMYVATIASDGSATEGHSFTSRPSRLTFKYQFIPPAKDASERFYVKCAILSGSTVIASKEVTDGPASSYWSTYTIDFDYTETKMKATSIQLHFKSTSDSNPNIDKNQSTEVGRITYGIHRGAQLRIDDIQLIY